MTFSTCNNCEHPFSIWLGGSEAAHWRKVLAEGEAPHVSLNFRHLRLTRKTPWVAAERFPDGQELMVDSGGYGAAQDDDHESYVTVYERWVAANIDRISLVTEYDYGGLEWVSARRGAFWHSIDPDKFVPIWHEAYGMEELRAMCKRYPRVGVVRPAKDIRADLNNEVRQRGVKLHGVGITNAADMTDVSYTSVSSTSWISPTKFGDFQCWANGGFLWYPVKTAEDAKRKHKLDIRNAGFDPEDILVGDNATVSAYTLWVWKQYEQWMQAKKVRSGQVVAIRPGVDFPKDVSDTAIAVDRHPANGLVKRAQTEMFPGLGLRPVNNKNKQEGGPEQVLVPSLSDSGIRRCDSCYFAEKCPAYVPAHSCSYKMPVSIETRQQLEASMTSLLEMQFGRIIFARATEEGDGTPASALVGAELDRYFGMVKALKEVASDETLLVIRAKGPQQQTGGVLSTLLGQFLGPSAAAEGERQGRENSAVDPQAAERYLGSIIDVGDK